MTTVIRLDAGALTALMEKLGDEFVLELRASVLEEACRRKIQAVTKSEVLAVVNDIVKSEVAQQVGTERVAWERRFELSESAQNTIFAKVQSAVVSALRDEVDKAIEKVRPDIASIAFSDVASRTRALVSDKVRQAVLEAMKKVE